MSTAVGLVGFGLAGRWFHAPLIECAGMKIAGVVTRQASAVRERLPDAHVVADLEELLGMEPLDLVVIATPSALHPAQAIASLRRGKHVVVDKPMALTSADAREMIAAAKKSERLLTVFQNRRWDSDFLTVRSLLAQNALGEINSFEAHWDRYRPQIQDRWRERPEDGGGVLHDLGSHLLDQALCLFGDPEWVQADVFAQRPGGRIDDAFEIRMGQGSRRITLSAGSVVADNQLRYRIHGSAASLRKTGLDPQEDQLRRNLLPGDPLFGIEPQAQWASVVRGDTGELQMIPAERGDWLSFYRGVRANMETGDPPPVLATQACRIIEILEAAVRSSVTGTRIYV